MKAGANRSGLLLCALVGDDEQRVVSGGGLNPPFYESSLRVKGVSRRFSNLCCDPSLLSEHLAASRDSPSGCFRECDDCPIYETSTPSAAQGRDELIVTSHGIAVIRFLLSMLTILCGQTLRLQLMKQPTYPAIRGRSHHHTLRLATIQQFACEVDPTGVHTN